MVVWRAQPSMSAAPTSPSSSPVKATMGQSIAGSGTKE